MSLSLRVINNSGTQVTYLTGAETFVVNNGVTKKIPVSIIDDLGQDAQFLSDLDNGVVTIDDTISTFSGLAALSRIEKYLVYLYRNKKKTYSCAFTTSTFAANPTDLFTLTGAANRRIWIKRVRLTMGMNAGLGATSTNIVIILLKRTTANAGGTSTAPVIASHDTDNPAATATPALYTANPTTLGTSAGNIRVERIAAVIPSQQPEVVEWEFGIEDGQCLTLDGTNEVMAINLNSATPPNQMEISVEWKEIVGQ